MTGPSSDGPFEYDAATGEILWQITDDNGMPAERMVIATAKPAFLASTLVGAANVGLAHMGRRMAERAVEKIMGEEG